MDKVTQHHKKHEKQSGNVLFLILIAVALFAALSYAVTQSTRGGGNADEETLSLEVATLMNQLTRIRTEIQRRKITSSSAIKLVSAAGGIFDPSMGLSVMYPSLDLYSNDSTVNNYVWRYLNNEFELSGSDMGTSAHDEYIYLQLLSEQACAEINKNLLGTTTIETASFSSGAADGSFSSVDRTPADSDFTNFNTVWDLPQEEGCFNHNTTLYSAFFQISVQ